MCNIQLTVKKNPHFECFPPLSDTHDCYTVIGYIRSCKTTANRSGSGNNSPRRRKVQRRGWEADKMEELFYPLTYNIMLKRTQIKRRADQ